MWLWSEDFAKSVLINELGGEAYYCHKKEGAEPEAFNERKKALTEAFLNKVGGRTLMIGENLCR